MVNTNVSKNYLPQEKRVNSKFGSHFLILHDLL